MIQRLDVRTPQVSIEAKIIFVNRTRADELGLTYDLKDSRGNSLNRLTSVPDPLNPGQLTGDNHAGETAADDVNGAHPLEITRKSPSEQLSRADRGHSIGTSRGAAMTKILTADTLKL